MPAAVLFANARSGRGRRWLFKVVAECEREGIDLFATHFALSPDGICRALEDAKSAGVSIVIASGGDGTVGSLLPHLAYSQFELGIIPAGTSNDFARSLLIPMSVRGAVQIIAEGNAARVDLGKVNDCVFGHAATVGINTEFAREANKLRRTLGRASYLIAGVRVYRRRNPFDAVIKVNGEQHCFKAFEIAFINAPIYGGPLALEITEVEITDSKLAVVVVEDIRFRAILKAIPLAVQRRSLRLAGVPVFSVKSAEVTTEHPMPVTADGEVGTETPLTVQVLPRALCVFVPEQFPTASHS